ncbi:MAG TPA: shikimate 5-dehydrogenase [Actinotalea sp.]|nr:shikimate 5-dehydrogenase [Actinotalea sp.]HQY33158.1 shikimate 5-dehydrogenase [Actinotalea sp.]HRA50844.1 shikimate 5-dehydrogenase [Actinotalea sp.]
MVNVIDRDTRMCISLAARPGNHGNRFHNFLYAELGLNYVYKSFTSSDIGATVGGIRSMGIRGAGVSMPYKESCMPFLDVIDPSAAAIDSVNTIVNDDGVLTGYNTDYLAIRTMLDEHGIPRTEDFALLGHGGMGKAVLAALRDAGFTRGVVVAPRNLERGRALAERYGFPAVADLGDARPQLLVNATPVGMAGGPEADDLPFPDEVVRAATTVLDVVYLPPDTPMVRLARALGTHVLAGDEVMALQALEQFVRYTGVRPTADQVARAEAYASA